MKGSDMPAQDEARVAEIQSTYERLGLGTATARAQFADWFPQAPAQLEFDVVISTTSNPHH